MSWTLIELESPTIQFNHAAHGGLTGIAELGSGPVYSIILSPWACPRVQQLNAARFEISCVASRHCCCICARDGCNLAVELTDRAAGSAALSRDGRIGFGGSAVKRQDTTAEIFIQDAFYLFSERSAPSPRRQDCEAVPQFCFTYRREIYLRAVLPGQPRLDLTGRRRAQKF